MKTMGFDITKVPEDLLPASEDLPGDLAEVAEVVGVPLTLKLVERFCGTKVYFHNMDSMLRKCRNRVIRKIYDQGETTVAQLARKFRISERWVSEILGMPESEDR